jgi:hypothetical protein
MEGDCGVLGLVVELKTMEAVQKEVFVRMTPTQKLRAAARLRESALELKAAWLRGRHPDWTEEAIAVEVRKAFADAGR